MILTQIKIWFKKKNQSSLATFQWKDLKLRAIKLKGENGLVRNNLKIPLHIYHDENDFQAFSLFLYPLYFYSQSNFQLIFSRSSPIVHLCMHLDRDIFKNHTLSIDSNFI